MTETSKPHEGLDGPQTAGVSRGAKMAAPIVAGVATWAVRRAMDSGFRRATGRPAPTASDLNILPGRIVLWGTRHGRGGHGHQRRRRSRDAATEGAFHRVKIGAAATVGAPGSPLRRYAWAAARPAVVGCRHERRFDPCIAHQQSFRPPMCASVPHGPPESANQPLTNRSALRRSGQWRPRVR